MPQTVTMQDLFDELQEIKQNMVSRHEVETLIETLEISHNTETVRQIKSSESDLASGKTKPVKSIKDLISEL